MEATGIDPTADGTPQAGFEAIRLRSYQAEMVEESLKRNIIVAMDTGSGKTHVALSRTAAELEACEPHKIVWFIAPTVTLCQQQACLFEKYLPAYPLRFLSGADNVERWSEQKVWDAVLKDIRIVLSTPQVLLDALTHAFVHITRFALLIFDEAHNCRGNHPANAIMARFYLPLLQDRSDVKLPGILGLTASPVLNAKANGLEIIEQSLNAITKTPKLHRMELLQFTHRPELVPLPYKYEPTEGPLIYSTLGSAYYGLDIAEDPYVLSLRKRIDESNDAEALKELKRVSLSYKTYVHEQVRKLYSRASEVLNELGGSATEFYIRSCIVRADYYLSRSGSVPSWSQAEAKYLREFLSGIAAVPSISSGGPPYEHLSSKVETLIDFLVAEARPDFNGIIFVEQRATVAVMGNLLSKHPKTKEHFNIGTFVGTSITSSRKLHIGIGDLVELKHQQQTLDDFRAGKKNLIVATNVLEEGIDVSNCHIVICFEEPKNLKSFIQRRGRARKQDSKFVIMLAGDSSLASSPERWLDLEEQMKEAYLNDLRKVKAAEEREMVEEESDLEMCVERTGALLTLDNAVQHLYHFCAILGSEQHVDLRPRYSFDESPDGCITSTVTLPNSSGHAWKTERQARKDASFQAYKSLYKAGLVNDNLLPLFKDTESPEFEQIEKRPSLTTANERMDPWTTIAKAHQAKEPTAPWYCIKLTLSCEGQKLANLLFLLPGEVAAANEVVLHWNETTKYVVTSEPIGNIAFSAVQIDTFRMATRTLLSTVYGTRMPEERYDFLAIFAPYDGDPANPTSMPQAFSKQMREARDVYKELQQGRAPPLGLVRERFNKSQNYIFQEFHTSEDGELWVLGTDFPKRRDFLHPIPNDVSHKVREMYTKLRAINADDCEISSLPAIYSIFAAFIPAVLHCYDVVMVSQKLCNTLLAPVGFKYTNFKYTGVVARALTASSTTDDDYQRMEFLGDTMLKFCTAVQIMAQKLEWPESYLTDCKDRIVSNGALAKAAKKVGLDYFIRLKPFTGLKWRPRYLGDELTALNDAPKQRTMSTKVLADVVEALIGAAYLEGGIPQAGRCIEALLGPANGSPWQPMLTSRSLLHSAARDAADAASAGPVHLEVLEELIGYEFSNKQLLLEAVTHPSFVSYRDLATSSYQRLEFLGDAILDHLVVRRVFAHNDPAPLPHHRMHTIRAGLVNAAMLAFLCMELRTSPDTSIDMDGERDGVESPDLVAEDTPSPLPPPKPRALYHFMRHTAPTLPDAMARAAARHEAVRAPLWAALRTRKRYPWTMLARCAADKFFSDIVEAVLGAIFLDSCGSAAATTITTNNRFLGAGNGSDGDNDSDGVDGTSAFGNKDADGLAACDTFLEKLGVLGLLERFLRDGVDCAHSKSRLGVLSRGKEVLYEQWDRADEGEIRGFTADDEDADILLEREASEGDGSEGEGPQEHTQRKLAPHYARVWLDGSVVGGWVEDGRVLGGWCGGESASVAETAAAEFAGGVLEKRGWVVGFDGRVVWVGVDGEGVGPDGEGVSGVGEGEGVAGVEDADGDGDGDVKMEMVGE
ncbi:uncharacterized protein K452DRAFT_350330 [Aplosporella prunicola CBS 121167]|uniref:Dicer-like protein 2 n=1 Tax=Aplosporella prunicola CBS 121167 TaxID=1176127 RepID=A0A6A6BII8_9PEZI|nr:uncharacterized protein K452DRAFT_350330 [Aplosporella prunicola CBS 121167]KAF2143233.1 hypothetical protein K452DRAFT_350330 [Aplosporella prunicola CBS 121167]